MNSLYCSLYLLLIGAVYVYGQGGRGRPSRGRSSRGRPSSRGSGSSTTRGWDRTTPPTFGHGGGGGGGWNGGGGSMGGFAAMGMGGFGGGMGAGFMPPIDFTGDHGMAPAGSVGTGHAAQMMALQNMKLTMGDNFNYNPSPPQVVYTRCPTFTSLRQCTVNPCPTRCKRYPTARCVTNPCGGCSPEWYIGGNRILDCD